MSQSIIEQLKVFDEISLADIGNVGLNNRVESKYILPETFIPELLNELSKEYLVLTIGGWRVQSYYTRYFDTKDFHLYLDHHNRKSNRIKVRCRLYQQTDDCFIEIKQRVKESQSIKTRIPAISMIDYFDEGLLPKPFNHTSLEVKLDNTFDRITLCNKNMEQRITIDTNIRWNDDDVSKSIPGLAILEIKQQKINNNLSIITWFKERMIQETSFSKYSIGAALIKPYLKQNNFKPIFLNIEKLKID